MRASIAVVALLMSSGVRSAEIAVTPRSALPVAASVLPATPLSNRLDAVLDGVDLRGYKSLGPQIDRMAADYERQRAPEVRLVLASLAQPKTEVVRSFQAAGIRAATARRAAALSEKAQAFAAKDAVLARALQRASKTATLASSADVSFAKIKALVDSVVVGWSKPEPAPAAAPAPNSMPVALAPASPAPRPAVAAAPPAPAAPRAPAAAAPSPEWTPSPDGWRKATRFFLSSAWIITLLDQIQQTPAEYQHINYAKFGDAAYFCALLLIGILPVVIVGQARARARDRKNPYVPRSWRVLDAEMLLSGALALGWLWWLL